MLLHSILRSTAAVAVLGVLCPAAPLDVQKTLREIEEHYNGAQTIQLNFSETYSFRGRKRSEKGVLVLRKPGKMRWQYVEPAGKLFVSDGQFLYSYTPDDNLAEKMKLKEADDLRAPLAFLLGRLNFREEFREFRASQDGADTFIAATPKSDKLPYTEVSFLSGPDSVIKKLAVKGQDGSLLEFVFDSEKRNPPAADSLFRFTPPPGAEFLDSSK